MRRMNFNNITERFKGRLAFFAVFSFIALSVTAQRTDIISDTLNDKSDFKSLITDKSFNTIGKVVVTQLNPQAISFVQEYIRKQGKELERMKVWGKPYFDLYDNILTQYGIPKEMKYLSVIESHLQSNLVSWAGAVGPWQLMDYEAKRFGLHTGRYADDRTDFYKSTYVAARLLKELYDEFGDWLLVIAAYNGGPGRVKRAIERTHSRDFWKLQYFLPEETRNHVKKFIGTHYVFEGAGGITTMTAEETAAYMEAQKHNEPSQLSDDEKHSTVVEEVCGRFNSLILSNNLMMDIQQFNKWNPGFDKAMAEGKKYQLRLAKDKMQLFEARKNEILMQSIHYLLEGATAASR
ncbi:MAG: lytic transglycosylase domain-containing protein [Bacteroidota bacterium]|nr:lytic transglycosylase domain-containing protein [Bacteroidota bacterium]